MIWVLIRLIPFFARQKYNEHSRMLVRRRRRREAYLQLLIVARALLSSRLELLAHLADGLVRLGEFCRRHCDLLLYLVSDLEQEMGVRTVWWCWFVGWCVFRVGSF
jgi:hypothetical protein